MKHTVKTYNALGETLYEENFKTADEAYNKYVEFVKILKCRLEKGEEITIARYNDGYVMHIQTIVGTH